MFIILRCWSPWNFNTTGRKCVPMTTHLRERASSFPRYFVLEGLMHCQRRENTRIFPLWSLFGWKVKGACLSLGTLKETNLFLPVTWQVTEARGARRRGRTNSRCQAAPAASRPAAPWDRFLGWKALPWIIFYQSGLSYKKVENRGNYFFLIMKLCFPDGLVLLESWFNAAFSIFICCSNKIKLYYFFLPA